MERYIGTRIRTCISNSDIVIVPFSIVVAFVIFRCYVRYTIAVVRGGGGGGGGVVGTSCWVLCCSSQGVQYRNVVPL